MIEADLFETKFLEESFDYILMLDSIEHVPQPKRFIGHAYRCLRSGGYFLIDTCPLYYSPSGHHLFEWFNNDNDPWVHLKFDFEEKLKKANVDEWTLERVAELNRVTHAEIVSFFKESGFVIEEEYRSKPNGALVELLERNRDQINWQEIKDPNSLFEDWILLVGRKP